MTIQLEGMGSIYNQIVTKRKRGRKQFALLVDPDKTDHLFLGKVAQAAQRSEVDFIMVGSSLLTNSSINNCIRILKDHCSIPMVLFPGNPLQISPLADGILFLSLISGRNPELLIGNHVVAAPLIKSSGLEVLSTGYVLVDGETMTTVAYMSNTQPIPRDKDEIAVCTSMAGEMLGHNLIYLDAGSGAKSPVSLSMISKVKEHIQVPLIVGGGIRNKTTALEACNSGADIIVVGNAIEEEQGAEKLLESIAEAVHDYA